MKLFNKCISLEGQKKISLNWKVIGFIFENKILISCLKICEKIISKLKSPFNVGLKRTRKIQHEFFLQTTMKIRKQAIYYYFAHDTQKF